MFHDDPKNLHYGLLIICSFQCILHYEICFKCSWSNNSLRQNKINAEYALNDISNLLETLFTILCYRSVHVRGLCDASFYNAKYLYNINLDGSILYLGFSSSFVIYDKVREILLFNISFQVF